MSMTVEQSAAVLADLRRARRKQRVAAIHWVDALYQVYVTGIVSVVIIVLVSGWVGDGDVSAGALADVRDHGPAVMGLLVALAIFSGLRAGSRGGPLALEKPDVRHVLLSPVDRGVALRGPAWRQLRFLTAVGAAVGAVAGQLALRRLPGNPLEWLLVGAASRGHGRRPRLRVRAAGLGPQAPRLGGVARGRAAPRLGGGRHRRQPPRLAHLVRRRPRHLAGARRPPVRSARCWPGSPCWWGCASSTAPRSRPPSAAPPSWARCASPSPSRTCAPSSSCGASSPRRSPGRGRGSRRSAATPAGRCCTAACARWRAGPSAASCVVLMAVIAGPRCAASGTAPRRS
ncbi:MAG: hypothetical protein R2711_01395 [Acidimicrobiales bacterium]